MKRWTPQEVDFLKSNWPRLSYRQIAETLGRTYRAVKEKRSESWKKQDRKAVQAKWKKENAEKCNIYSKKYKSLVKEQVKKLVGDSCSLCGNKIVLFHEKYYRPHPPNPTSLFYVRKHSDDFIPLCRKCHVLIHYLYSLFGIRFEEFVEWIEQKRCKQCYAR